LVALEVVQKWRDRIGMTAVHREIMQVLRVSRMTHDEVTDSQQTGGPSANCEPACRAGLRLLEERVGA